MGIIVDDANNSMEKEVLMESSNSSVKFIRLTICGGIGVVQHETPLVLEPLSLSL